MREGREIHFAYRQLHPDARAARADIRDSGGSLALAGDSAALPVYPLLRAVAGAECGEDGGDAIRHPDFVGIGAMDRPGALRGAVPASEGLAMGGSDLALARAIAQRLGITNLTDDEYDVPTYMRRQQKDADL